MPDSFTILDGGEVHLLDARVDGERVALDARSLHERLGWELKPEGLCRGDVCIPVRDRVSLVSDPGLDLERLAALWDRPLAVDAGERCAALGEGHLSRASRLASLEAPDFELPDLDGRTHRLSDQRGRKVLLIAYASW
jgi:hypothetical protein